MATEGTEARVMHDDVATQSGKPASAQKPLG